MVTATGIEDVRRARSIAERVPDPELPMLTLADLGVLRAVEMTGDGTVVASLTPTYSGCPATIAIEQSIREALDQAGFRSVGIERVLFPPWTTEWISDRGRQRLKDYGIAPPSLSATAECPQCGSTDTEEVSRFGSTPCKAQWRCKDCLEPFDYFKVL